MIRQSVFANWYLGKLGSYPATENGDTGTIFLNDYISEYGSQDLEKIFLDSKTDKRFLKTFTCISKEQRKN